MDALGGLLVVGQQPRGGARRADVQADPVPLPPPDDRPTATQSGVVPPTTVSFGSIVYFLRSMYEYGEAFGSDTARALFTGGVQQVLTIQGDDGGWPWMIDVRTGRPFDLYPIFTVHQDSMAMLFLLPAEREGVRGASEAIKRSLEWNFGHNELGARMVLTEPYPWIYRSIERDENWTRARRFLRGLGPATGGSLRAALR